MLGAAMENLSGLVRGFYTSMDEYSDPRMKDYLFLQGLSPLLIILPLYLYVCTKAIPNYMKNREPFRLKQPILVYNLINIVTCAWLVNEMLQSGWLRDYSYKCEPLDRSNSPSALRMARGTWVYFMLKLFDLLDTIFFVLRKKDNQVTHLHLYHHVSMPILSWLHAKFIPGGHGTFGIMLNSSVHVAMYSYYLLSALGPKVQKYLWWKKYLTSIQIIQFIIVLIHLSKAVIFDCGYPMALYSVLMLNVLYNLYQFSLFYKRMYAQKKSKTKLK